MYETIQRVIDLQEVGFILFGVGNFFMEYFGKTRRHIFAVHIIEARRLSQLNK